MQQLNDQDYSKEYSKNSFWEKIKNYAKEAGLKVIYSALLLYYASEEPEVPKKAKATIYGALGYFILPLDLIPDHISVVGFADDASILLWALLQVAVHINLTTKAKAKAQLENWFGEVDENKIIDIETKLSEVKF